MAQNAKEAERARVRRERSIIWQGMRALTLPGGGSGLVVVITRQIQPHVVSAVLANEKPKKREGGNNTHHAAEKFTPQLSSDKCDVVCVWMYGWVNGWVGGWVCYCCWRVSYWDR